MKPGKLFIGVFAALFLTAGCVSMDKREADPEKAAQIYADLGLQYLRQGNLELARVKLERSLELEGKNADAHHYIAEVYKQLGNRELALQHYSKAVRYDADNPMLLNNYGAFLCEQGRLKEAEEYFLQAAHLPTYRTPELAYENLALCALQTEHPETAEAYFRKALQIRPSLPKSLYQMALISYQQGEYLSARAFIERFHAIGRTAQSLKLGIRIEEALGAEAAADKYRKLLSTRFPDAAQE
jgi:type IV pilus assembly protein PilF